LNAGACQGLAALVSYKAPTNTPNRVIHNSEYHEFITKYTFNISKLVILYVSCFYLHIVLNSARKKNCIVILHNAKDINILHRVPLPLTHPEHLSSPLVFSWVFVSQTIVLCVVFSIVLFIYSSIFGFWLPLWYLQTLLIQFQAILTTDGRF